MTNVFEDVTKQVMQLSRQQRLALAGLLLQLEDIEECKDADAVWDAEIRARIQAIDSGTAVGVPYEDVMDEARRRLAP